MKLKKITIDRLEDLVKTKLHENRYLEISTDFIINNLKDSTDYINYKNKVSSINLDLKELGLDIFSEFDIKYEYTRALRKEIEIKHQSERKTIRSILIFILESSDSIDEIYDKIEKHYNITMERPCIK